MSVQIRPSMDPESLDVYENGIHVGMAQWHGGRKRFVPDRQHCFFGISFAVIKAVTEMLESK